MANSAPVLNTSLTRINSIYEDTYTGSVRASFFNDGVDAFGNFVPGATDVDGNLLGIAIIGQTGIAGGLLEYSVDELHWFTAVMPPAGSVVVFKADTWLRYTPPVDANGTSTITYHTWDGTGGYNSGDIVNITAVGTGGSTPFSAASTTHQLVVTPDDGKVITNMGGYDEAAGVAVDANGKIVVAGSSFNTNGTENYAITRYNSNGSLDTSFSLDGKVTLNSTGWIYSFELDASGKYLLAGFSSVFNPLNSTTTNTNVITRFNTDGSLDTTFGTGGRVSTLIGDGITTSLAYSGEGVTLQVDGKILSAGVINNNGLQEFMVVRYTASGTLDTTFDADGYVSTGFGAGNNGFIDNILLQADGKIVATGAVLANTITVDYSATNTLVRYNSNGSLDTTFGVNGIASFDIGMGNEDEGSTLQADGKIIIVGSTSVFDYINPSASILGDIKVARINTNGTLDTSFGTNGVVTTDLGGDDVGTIVKMQSDGKILVAGYTSSNSFGENLAVVRYNTNGTLDSTFGTSGKLVTGLPFNNIEVSDLALQADGKILISGTNSGSGQDANFATIRLNANGTLDNTFVGQNNAPVFNVSAPFSVSAFSGDVAFEVPASAGVSATDADGRFGDQIGSIITSVSATSITGDLLQVNSSQYSTNGGLTWLAMPTLTAGTGIVLAGTTLVRYMPVDGASGTYSFTYRAWDGTGSFTSGQVVSLATIGTGGGTSPFSTGSATLNVNVIGATDGTANADNMTAIVTGSYLRGLAGNDSITGGIASDKLDGGDNNDTINGGDGSDRVFGGNGDDTLIDSDNYVADTLDGGAGNDTANFSGAFTTINANLALGRASIDDGFGNMFVTTTLIGIENLTGTTNNDVLTGDSFANTLIGDLGFDTIDGGQGNDILRGGDQADVLRGGEGNDSLYGGKGLDNLDGGVGNDFLYGLLGADTLTGGDGFDLLEGGDGDDNLNGGKNGDTIVGGLGNDILGGGQGLDNLNGGDGNDVIIGALGTDTLTGGLGADTFDFNAITESLAGALRDIIADFSTAQLDKIDLSTIDASSSAANDQAFLSTILSSGAFTAEGQLRLVGNILSGNTDSDFATSEFEIQLTGVTTLTSADFIL